MVVSMLEEEELVRGSFWGDFFTCLFEIGQERLIGNEPGEMGYIWDQETTQSTLEPTSPWELNGP